VSLALEPSNKRKAGKDQEGDLQKNQKKQVFGQIDDVNGDQVRA